MSKSKKSKGYHKTIQMGRGVLNQLRNKSNNSSNIDWEKKNQMAHAHTSTLKTVNASEMQWIHLTFL